MGGAVVVIESKAEWDAAIAGAKPCVVDFTATWCGPCQAIAPYYEQLSEAYPELVFLKVDVDKQTEVATAVGITAMPTFHAYKGGVKVASFTGASKDKLKEMCEDLKK